MWIQTYRGRAVELMNPTPDDIDPTELCILLGRLNRFGCHTRVPYTVADHSWQVARICPSGFELAGMIHDGHEGYFGIDMTRPMKLALGCEKMRDMEMLWDRAIAERFGVEPRKLWTAYVKHADAVMLATERRDVMGRCEREWDPLPEPLKERVVISPEPAVAFAKRLELMIHERIDIEEIRWACGEPMVDCRDIPA